MPDLDEFALAKLAREVAMNIRPFPVILADFGLDENGFYEISKNAFYKRAQEQFTLEWNSALSANERVKLISAAYLEQALPRLWQRMTGDEPLAAAADVAKLFSRNAGLGEVKSEQKGAERFQITINLGADKEIYDKPIAVEQPADNTLALTVMHEDGRVRPDAQETTHGEEKLDGGSREEAGSPAPLTGRAGGGEDPISRADGVSTPDAGENRESRPLEQPNPEAARRAGEDVRQTPAISRADGVLTPNVNKEGWGPTHKCTIEGCQKLQKSRGLCANHYQKDLHRRRKEARYVRERGVY
jgi:hypothetical protein